MKIFVLSAILLIPTLAFAQQTAVGETTGQPDTFHPMIAYDEARSQLIPDYGYVAYDDDGRPVKAFGPGTPVRTNNGRIEIIGGGLPSGWTVKTEDAPTYLNALARVGNADDAESDYTKKIREVVDSINDGASIVRETLCSNPARPSLIRVEVAGGFSLGVYGGITSTVDWNLEEICPTETATTQ